MKLQKERMQPGCELGGNDTREMEAISSRLGLKIEERLAIVVFLGREELRGERIDFFPSTITNSNEASGHCFLLLKQVASPKKEARSAQGASF